MNKYLIVVFCVLTGCAVVVPYSECEAQNMNAQLLADWYADYGDIQDDSYAIHYILRQDVSAHDTTIKTVIPGNRQLVKNMPSLPVFKPEEKSCWPPLPLMREWLFPQLVTLPLAKGCGSAMNIRAPDMC